MRTNRALVAAEPFGHRRARTSPGRPARVDPRRFGRAAAFQLAMPEDEPRWTASDDMQLFAATFAAGFVFVSILIG